MTETARPNVGRRVVRAGAIVAGAIFLAFAWHVWKHHRGTLNRTMIESIHRDLPGDVGALLRQGADANVREAPIGKDAGSRLSALMIASAAGDPRIVQTLLDHGARVDTRDASARTAVTWSVAPPAHDAVLLMLLNHGGDADAQDKFGDTPLIYALQSGEGDLARLLIAHGADPNKADHQGTTPLMAAAAANDPATASLLLSRGARIGDTDRNGETAVIHAVATGALGSLRLLARHGADLNVRTSSGATALWIAAHYGQPDSARFLLHCGMRPSKTDPADPVSEANHRLNEIATGISNVGEE